MIWLVTLLTIPIAALVLVLTKAQPRFANGMGVLQWMGVAMCLSYLLAFAVPFFIRKKAIAELVAKKQPTSDTSHQNEAFRERERFSEVWQIVMSSFVISISFVTGASFANLMFYHEESCLLNLLLGLVGTIFMVLKYPTITGLAQETESILEEVERIS